MHEAPCGLGNPSRNRGLGVGERRPDAPALVYKDRCFPKLLGNPGFRPPTHVLALGTLVQAGLLGSASGRMGEEKRYPSYSCRKSQLWCPGKRQQDSTEDRPSQHHPQSPRCCSLPEPRAGLGLFRFSRRLPLPGYPAPEAVRRCRKSVA